MTPEDLLREAKSASAYARPRAGGTKVGCAMKLDYGGVFTGVNFIGPFGTGIHSEICAISKAMESMGVITDIAIYSEVDGMFTPCGACLDYIHYFGGPKTRVHIMNQKDERQSFFVDDLLPFYPRY